MAKLGDCIKQVGAQAELENFLLDGGRVLPETADARLKEALIKKRAEAKHNLFKAQKRAVASDRMHSFIDDYKKKNPKVRTATAARAYITTDDMATGRMAVDMHMEAYSRSLTSRLNAAIEAADNRTWKQKLFSTGAVDDTGYADNIVRELFGAKTGDPDAVKFAKLWTEVAEMARVAFNKAGGDIKKLEDWGMQQKHITTKMAGRKDEWIAFVGNRIDRARMGLETTADVERVLAKVYDTIMTNGASKLGEYRTADIFQSGPEARSLARSGNGSSIANRHMEHRALHFKDGESWLQYNKEFADNDPIGAMVQHLQGIGREIGAMDIMGPNPSLLMDEVIGRIRHEGELGRMTDGVGKRWEGVNNLKATWANIEGVGTDSVGLADWSAGARTFLSLGKLGGVVLSSLPDLANSAGVAMFNGTGQIRWAKSWLKQITPGLRKMDQEKAIRLGVMAQQVVDDFVGDARFTDPETLSIARKASNAMYKAALLTPWDRGNRTAFKLSVLDALSDAPKKLSDFKTDGAEGRMLRMINKYGITEAQWKKFQQAKDPAEGNMINPMHLDIDTSAALIGLIESEASLGVVQPGARTQALTNFGLEKGTAMGEAARFSMQWKTYPVAYAQMRLSNFANTAMGKHGDSAGFRMAYVAQQMTAATALGMLAIQAKEISKGRDPIDVDEYGGQLIAMGFLQAGVGGLWADAVFGWIQNGRNPAALLAPPALGLFDDLLGFSLLANKDELGDIDERFIENLGAGAVRALGWVPGQSLFYLRAAWEQYVIPNAAELISDKAKRQIKNRNRRLRRDRGQDRWITEDSIRLPDM